MNAIRNVLVVITVIAVGILMTSIADVFGDGMYAGLDAIGLGFIAEWLGYAHDERDAGTTDNLGALPYAAVAIVVAGGLLFAMKGDDSARSSLPIDEEEDDE